MFELFFCSLFTLLPDYLFRRYGQGKRIGSEITIYSVWYELRYGIVTCAILTVTLITLIFYFHPSTQHTTLTFRTLPILPETSGRIVEVYVKHELESQVKAGDPIIRLDGSEQEAAINSAKLQISEIDAEIALAKGERNVAEGGVSQAESALKQAVDELETKLELQKRNADVVTPRQIEKLQNAVGSREGALAAMRAQKDLIDTKINISLPARRSTAEARLKEAEIDLAKKTVYAGVAGTVSQFTMRKGDIVNPLMRPGGILIPSDASSGRMVAGFGQIEAQVLKVGMVGEITCSAVPFTVIPVVVTEIQAYLASGQIGASDRLADVARDAGPGTITTLLEPLYKGGFDKLPGGARCLANVYTSNHDRLTSGEPLGTGQFLFLHVIDTVGLVHAILLRVQALLLPIQTLVLTGH